MPATPGKRKKGYVSVSGNGMFWDSNFHQPNGSQAYLRLKVVLKSCHTWSGVSVLLWGAAQFQQLLCLYSRRASSAVLVLEEGGREVFAADWFSLLACSAQLHPY